MIYGVLGLLSVVITGFAGARFPALQSCRLLLKKIIQNYSIGLLASSILLFCLWLPLIGKTDDSTLLSLDRIFTHREFAARSFGPAWACLAEGENTQYHRYDIYTWYLNQNLPGGGR